MATLFEGDEIYGESLCDHCRSEALAEVQQAIDRGEPRAGR